MLDSVSHIIGRADGMDEAEILYPIANRMNIVYALNDAGVPYSPRRQLEEVVVFRTHNATHVGGAFQMDRVILPERTANDVDARKSQLVGDFRRQAFVEIESNLGLSHIALLQTACH